MTSNNRGNAARKRVVLGVSAEPALMAKLPDGEAWEVVQHRQGMLIGLSNSPLDPSIPQPATCCADRGSIIKDISWLIEHQNMGNVLSFLIRRVMHVYLALRIGPPQPQMHNISSSGPHHHLQSLHYPLNADSAFGPRPIVSISSRRPH